MLRHFIRILAVCVCTVGVSAHAQTWPSRPIELVHGFGAGGQADTVSRLIAQRLGEQLKNAVVVVARTGAGGNIASESVARATPDGHTIILLTGGHAVSAALYKKLNFDPVNDFAFIAQVSRTPFVIAVRAESPIKDLSDLIARAKRAEGQLTYSSVGVGSTQHLTGALLAQTAGIQLTHVPYRGGTQPLTDLLGGQIDMLVDSIPVTRGAIEGGRIRALGITSPEPWPALPKVPLVKTTLPDFTVMSWLGIAAPAGTPAAVVQRLNAEMQTVLSSPELRQRLEEIGSQVASGTPQDFRQLVVSEIARWKDVITRAKIEVN